MRILYLTNHVNIGGISSYVISLGQGLLRRGHRVYLASGGGELRKYIEAAGIDYIPTPIKTKAEISLKVFLSYWKLRAIIRREKIDIIHANTRVTQVLACLLKRDTQLPFVSTCHGFFKKRFFRRLFPCWGDRVIAISDSVREHLVQDFSVAEANIRVVHNGIDLEKFSAVTAESRKVSRFRLQLSDGPVIGVIARLSDVKGQEYLIRAMQEVRLEFPRAKLLIVGSGRMGKKLEELTEQLGLRESVKFIPSVMDTREVLAALDLFVMPSLKEGLGLGLMEAMASGLCVIGSSVGGIRSLIQQGSTGVLVKPADAGDLALKINSLLKNPQEMARLSGNARAFIRENFSQELMVQKTERIYEECLKEKH